METKTHSTDPVAIVTGGAGTLGRAVMRRFTDAGFRVLAVDVAVPPLDEIVPDARPDKIAAVRADLGTIEAAEAVVREALERFGDVHALAHLVGGWSGKPVAETSLEEWDAQFALNLVPAFVMCRAVVPLMVEHGYGRIVCVGSRTAVRPTANQAAYNASKAGVVALVQTLAEEVKHAGVTANCVLPSIIDTPTNREAMPKSDPDHWVKPERLADVIRFLCSPESAEITGAAIPVYGRA